ncbi:Fic family protein [Glaesserella parasuis]|uniref:Fic family protein n=1 Tax=Glaesserella parasuis TaxID=738 RepID=UPI000992C657|nr:Fic family protein [Glaesserella parasuis]MDE3931898.1 Fic family protein [Glaesserella parasuis]MDE3935746.1 Fic family protein [Glaesserella parasuis]MDE3938493.1 Fic family protein [Glaesserella parasuis]MDE3943427.1 Fic family protein [Glaesserella parasuis]MDE3953471.1 Fic family protein [Glaesserella parasuis]
MNINLDNAVFYHHGKFPPEIIQYQGIIPALTGAIEAIARYDQMLKNMHNGEILLAPLRNQEAVISSRMEGTISTMDEILQYEADYPETDGKSVYGVNVRSDIIETVLYQRTLKNTQKAMSEGYPLTKSLLKGMHQQLLSFGRGANKSPGEFKKEQNYLADTFKKSILFVPISPEKLEEGLDRLFRYINENQDHILIKTGVTHLEFEALHPFQDGNGRIGRMLITLMLWNANIISAPHFYISGYFENNKNTYIDLMRRVSETGDWNEWIVFFLNAIETQAKQNLEIAENIRRLYEEMKSIFSDTLSSKWAVMAQDFIFTNPIFRNSQFIEKSGIPSTTATRFTKLLVEKGILTTKEEAAGRKSALYSFDMLMDLVRV